MKLKKEFEAHKQIKDEKMEWVPTYTTETNFYSEETQKTTEITEFVKDYDLRYEAVCERVEGKQYLSNVIDVDKKMSKDSQTKKATALHILQKNSVEWAKESDLIQEEIDSINHNIVLKKTGYLELLEDLKQQNYWANRKLKEKGQICDTYSRQVDHLRKKLGKTLYYHS